MKKVLLVTDGLVHPPFTARLALKHALAAVPGIHFEHTGSLEKTPDDLAQFSALVLYFHHKAISQHALAKLDAYVSGGGGILGVHSVTASFKEQLDYFKILGGRFIGHGAVEPFEITPLDAGGVFTGIPAFTVMDELYIHDLNPAIKVHFTTQHQGETVPAVWTYRYGEGRVCYAVPGHTAKSMRDPNYRQILRQGLLWVCAR